MLPFGKWFLDRKRENTEEEKKECSTVATGIQNPNVLLSETALC